MIAYTLVATSLLSVAPVAAQAQYEEETTTVTTLGPVTSESVLRQSRARHLLDDTSGPQTAATALEAAGDLVATPDEDVVIEADGVVAESDSSRIEVPFDPTEEIAVSTEAGAFKVSLPKDASAAEQELESGGVVYESGGQGSAFAVVPAETGDLQILAIRHDSTAPTSFDFDHQLAPGARLVQRGDSVEILSEHGGLIASIEAPWAIDARGRPVDAEFSVRGNRLTLHVAETTTDGTPAEYPVVADPDYKIRYDWKDKEGNTVRIRQFGLEKAWGHNLSVRTVRLVTQKEKRKLDPGTKTAYKYEAIARLYECSNLSCTVRRSQRVRVVYEATRANDGFAKGVITAYCPGAGPRCPNFVNEVLY